MLCPHFPIVKGTLQYSSHFSEPNFDRSYASHFRTEPVTLLWLAEAGGRTPSAVMLPSIPLCLKSTNQTGCVGQSHVNINEVFCIFKVRSLLATFSLFNRPYRSLHRALANQRSRYCAARHSPISKAPLRFSFQSEILPSPHDTARTAPETDHETRQTVSANLEPCGDPVD